METGLVKDPNGMKMAWIPVSGLGLVLLISTSCRQTALTVPPDVYGPLYPVTLCLKNGTPVLKIAFSSRGVQELSTLDEPELGWTAS